MVAKPRERANGRTGERANERTGERANGRTGERANERTGERANGRTSERANGRTGERANGRTSERANGRTGRSCVRLFGCSVVRGVETARARDDGTTGRRDNETTRPRDHGTTQAFPVILRRSQLCEAVRGSLVSEWCRYNARRIWRRWAVLRRTAHCRHNSLAAVDVPLSHQAKFLSEGVRCGAIPKAEWMGVYLGVHPHSDR